MTKWISIFALFSTMVSFAQNPDGVSAIDNSVSVQQTAISRNGQAAQAELKVFRTRLSASGETFDRDIVIVREPVTGLYAWTLLDISELTLSQVPDDFRRWFRVAASDQEIAIFSIAGQELRVTSSTERQTAMQSCQDLVTQLLTGNVDALLGSGNPAERVTSLASAIDASLFVPADGGTLTEMPEISGAVKTAAGWTVTIKGLNSTSGTVGLNPGLAIVSASPAPALVPATDLVFGQVRNQ